MCFLPKGLVIFCSFLYLRSIHIFVEEIHCENHWYFTFVYCWPKWLYNLSQCMVSCCMCTENSVAFLGMISYFIQPASECTKFHLNILTVECHVDKSHKDNFYAQNMRTGQEMFTFFTNWPHSFMSQAWTQLVSCHRRQSTAQLWNNIIQYNTKLYFTQIT